MTWQPPTGEEVQSGPRVKGFTFYEALHAAVDPTETKPLADFMRDPAARAQLTDNQFEGLAEWIASLAKRLPGNPNKRDLELREAARHVDAAKREWRLNNGRDPSSPVPPHITKGFIADAIARIAQQRGIAIPANSGLYHNLENHIRNGLKARRF
jgi:hypothetical protein